MERYYETYLNKCHPDQKAKADAGKYRPSLVPMQIIKDIAEVREYGNKKYGDPNNWKQVEMERYIDATWRHLIAFTENIYGKDAESGIYHYKHIECNMAFISDMMAKKLEQTE